MKNKIRILKIFLCIFLNGFPLLACLPVYAQQYTGMSGLIHVPSADMDKEGDARLGVHFLNREFTPDVLKYGGKKYHTMTHYLSITPFKWLEIGYTCTLLRDAKTRDWVEDNNSVGLYRKDRYFSAKIQFFAEKEGKWWPSFAVGTNDTYEIWNRKDPQLLTEEDTVAGKKQTIGNNFFSNYYFAISKHFTIKEHSLGIHLAYREWQRAKNSKWNGLVGGITYRPSFAKKLRAIAEYTGNEINIGTDCLLWKHLLLQAALQDGKYFSGGVCFQMKLF